MIAMYQSKGIYKFSRHIGAEKFFFISFQALHLQAHMRMVLIIVLCAMLSSSRCARLPHTIP